MRRDRQFRNEQIRSHPRRKRADSRLKTTLDGARLAVNQADVAEDLALLCGVAPELVKLGVVFGQLGDELFSRRNVAQSGRD